MIEIYTDGAARGNPGNGGYCAIIVEDNSVIKTLSQGYVLTTNNRMEIMAAIVGLEALKDKCDVKVYSDSAYLVNAINLHWIDSWKSAGWKKKGGELKNIDLWKRMYDLIQFHNVKFEKVKGHSGNFYNENCDTVATKVADGDNLIHDSEYEKESGVEYITEPIVNNKIVHFSKDCDSFCSICGKRDPGNLRALELRKKINASISGICSFTVCNDCIAQIILELCQ